MRRRRWLRTGTLVAVCLAGVLSVWHAGACAQETGRQGGPHRGADLQGLPQGGPPQAVMVANSTRVFVLSGNTLYQFSANKLKLVNKTTLPEQARGMGRVPQGGPRGEGQGAGGADRRQGRTPGGSRGQGDARGARTVTGSRTTSLTCPMVDTGQSACYDNTSPITPPSAGQPFYGQDAQYRGNAPGYKDNGDGTVTDLVTGLMWQRDYDARPHRWSDAPQMLADLNQQALGGHSDWRLPTIKELYSLWNGNTGWPYVDATYFPMDERELGHAIFWTRNKYSGRMESSMSEIPGDAPGADLVFGVNFGTGHIKGYSIRNGPPHFLRFVRGNTSYGVNRFKDNGDGTVTDLATGLMWPRRDSGSGMNWQDALAWVQTKNSAGYLGHNDWRLPNTRELQGLVDYSRSPGATSASNVGPAIDPVFTCTAITNEAGKPDYPWYWTGTSAIHDVGGAYNLAWYVAFGRAVDSAGKDLHGAGAVRFDLKVLGKTGSGDGERVLNYVRPVRNAR